MSDFQKPTPVKRKKTLVLFSDAARNKYHFYANICGMWKKTFKTYHKLWSLSEEEIKKKIDTAVLKEYCALHRFSLPSASEADAWNCAKIGADRHLLQANLQATRTTLWIKYMKVEEVWREYNDLARFAEEIFRRAVKADDKAMANFGLFNPTVKPFLKRGILKIMKKERRKEERRLARENRT